MKWLCSPESSKLKSMTHADKHAFSTWFLLVFVSVKGNENLKLSQSCSLTGVCVLTPHQSDTDQLN